MAANEQSIGTRNRGVLSLTAPGCTTLTASPDTAHDEPMLTRAHELNATILLVEDQVAVRTVIARALRNAGFTVHEAGDAEQAEGLLASTAGDQVSLIVTDMMMPGKTGAELTSGPLVADRGIPVIIMSGYSEEPSNLEWQLPPNASFVEKPVRLSDLLVLIAKLIG
jgi:CheY-like chemotaxis protein